MTNSNAHYNVRLAEAKGVSRILAPYAVGNFVVGSVAYNPLAVSADSDLDIVAVIADFGKAKFDEIGRKLGVELNKDATYWAFMGEVGVFDARVDSGKGFETGVYFRSLKTHLDICDFRSIRRFAAREGIPKSCNYMDLKGRKKLIDTHEDIPGGRIYTHWSVKEDEDGIWLSVPATNLLMSPLALHGSDFLVRSFRLFREGLRNKLIRRYGLKHSDEINLINSFPEALRERMTPEMKKQLEEFF